MTNFERGVSGSAANDNTDGPAVVDIQRGDVAFNTVRCGTWTKVGKNGRRPAADTRGDRRAPLPKDATPEQVQALVEAIKRIPQRPAK
jgi:hypothetical protein